MLPGRIENGFQIDAVHLGRLPGVPMDAIVTEAGPQEIRRD